MLREDPDRLRQQELNVPYLFPFYLTNRLFDIESINEFVFSNYFYSNMTKQRFDRDSNESQRRKIDIIILYTTPLLR